MGDVTRALVGLEDFEVTGGVETAAGVLEVSVRVARPDAACVRCGTFSSRVKEYRTCRVRDALSYERLTVLVWTKRRFRCETPGCVRSFTESTRQVAPRLLGVDETTFRRYRNFMTGLVDLDGPRLWDFIEGRSKKVLVDRLEALGESVHSIEAVVIDPYAGYKAAVRDAAPRAARVADHFHIVGLANAALTDVRTRRQQEICGHRGRKGDPLWSVRHDLLRAREHLTDRAWGRLGAAFQADWWDELECAWTLKEMLRDLYTSADRAAAEAALADWHTWAGAFDVAETNRLAKTLRSWEPELLAYFDTGLTNGPTEGINRIIKAVKRQGFGYTNADYRIRVLYRCA